MITLVSVGRSRGFGLVLLPSFLLLVFSSLFFVHCSHTNVYFDVCSVDKLVVYITVVVVCCSCAAAVVVVVVILVVAIVVTVDFF